MKELLKYVCDIIQTELQLEDDQVYLYEQKVDIPADDRMYVVVGILSQKPFGASQYESPNSAVLGETTTLNIAAQLTLDVFSHSIAAIDRLAEVVMALNGSYSKKLQAENGFMLARVTSGISNLSGIEGAAIPYRFQVVVGAQFFTTKQKLVDFYDTFTDSIKTES